MKYFETLISSSKKIIFPYLSRSSVIANFKELYDPKFLSLFIKIIFLNPSNSLTYSLILCTIFFFPHYALDQKQ